MNPTMPRKSSLYSKILCFIICIGAVAANGAPREQSIDAPNGQAITIKMIGPAAQTTDLQIICILKHQPAGDQYIDAMDDLNKTLHHLLSQLRDRDEFSGELGETMLLTPPAGSITPTRLLLIGIGDESDITPDKLQLVGAIAAREAARLGAARVSFAPTLRDQGSNRVEVGVGDAAFVKGWILAYDTEKRLSSQRLAPPVNVSTLTIEAGPKFFDAAVENVTDAERKAATTIGERPSAPFLGD